jgi:hypothetical protein
VIAAIYNPEISGPGRGRAGAAVRELNQPTQLGENQGDRLETRI